MKISPIAQPSGASAGQAINVAGNDRVSSDRLAQAKAIAKGDQTFSIRPREAPPVEDKQVDRIKKRIQMKTNFSTDRGIIEAEAEEPAAPVDDKSIAPLNIDDTQSGTVEATQPLSPQFAALAKQRRALQVKEKEIADREARLAAGSTEGGSETVLTRLKANPLSVLQEAGVTYDDLTKAIMANPVNPELEELKAQVKALKEGVDKTFSERDQQTEAQVLSEIRLEADGLVAEGDTYEMIRATGSSPDVVKLIHRIYKETGRVIDTRTACDMVEEDLVNETLKIANVKKIQSRITPAASLKPQTQPNQMRTLTNRDTAIAPLDRRARALKAWNESLK
jgi:hypothetical protein